LFQTGETQVRSGGGVLAHHHQNFYLTVDIEFSKDVR